MPIKNHSPLEYELWLRNVYLQDSDQGEGKGDLQLLVLRRTLDPSADQFDQRDHADHQEQKHVVEILAFDKMLVRLASRDKHRT